MIILFLLGVFIATSSVEVATNTKFSFTVSGIRQLLNNFHLFAVVLFFEILLRIFLWITQNKDGRPRYPLLTPAYFCMITPLFYCAVWLLKVDKEQITNAGYFFPATTVTPTCNGQSTQCTKSTLPTLFGGGHVWDLIKVIHIRHISWKAVTDSLGTIAALVSFSALHIPINIPAFAISTDVGKLG